MLDEDVFQRVVRVDTSSRRERFPVKSSCTCNGGSSGLLARSGSHIEDRAYLQLQLLMSEQLPTATGYHRDAMS